MTTVDVGTVYQKIKEMSRPDVNSKKTISIDRLVGEFSGDREIIREYIIALMILELIQYNDVNGTISLK